MTTLRFVYTLNSSLATKNESIRRWTSEITNKYLPKMSASIKETVQAVKVTGRNLKGEATGAGSIAIFGGNPA